MNKQGQLQQGGYSIFTVIFIVIVFIIVFGVALAPFITTTTGIATELGGLTGLEAFFMDNFLLWIILIFIIWVLWVTR